MAQDGLVWSFGFGANINPWKLEKKRRIVPVETVVAQLPGHVLLFNHRGGFGNIEPGSDREASLSVSVQQPLGVHGVLLLLRLSDFGTLAGMEHQYTAKQVTVQAYNGAQIVALAFVSPQEFKTVERGVLPTQRYKLQVQTHPSEQAVYTGTCA